MNELKKFKPIVRRERPSEIRTFDEVTDIRTDKDFADYNVKEYAEAAIDALKEGLNSVEALPMQEIKVAAISMHMVLHDPRNPDRTQMEYRVLTTYAEFSDGDALDRLIDHLVNDDSSQGEQYKEYEGVAYQ